MWQQLVYPAFLDVSAYGCVLSKVRSVMRYDAAILGSNPDEFLRIIKDDGGGSVRRYRTRRYRDTGDFIPF